MGVIAQSIIDKVTGLLAKAASTDSKFEAEALTERAATIMAKHSISQALLAAKAQQDLKPNIREIPLDDGYILSTNYLLTVVADTFNCRVIRTPRRNARNGRPQQPGKVEMFGFDSDIDAALVLFTSLLQQAITKSLEGIPRGVHMKKWRHTFITGFTNAISKRLKAAQETATTEATATEPGTALVLRDRSIAVNKLVREKYPRLSNTKYYVNDTMSAGAYTRGRVAGENANLHDKKSVPANQRTIGS